jgi:hypothetical protein
MSARAGARSRQPEDQIDGKPDGHYEPVFVAFPLLLRGGSTCISLPSQAGLRGRWWVVIILSYVLGPSPISKPASGQNSALPHGPRSPGLITGGAPWLPTTSECRAVAMWPLTLRPPQARTGTSTSSRSSPISASEKNMDHASFVDHSRRCPLLSALLERSRSDWHSRMRASVLAARGKFTG